MDPSSVNPLPDHSAMTRPRLRVWHLSLLTAFVAVAIANIQAQRQADALLVGLAAAGFAVYGLLGYLGWRLLHRFRPRVADMWLVASFLIAMSCFFLISSVAYLVIEYWYLTGR